MTDLEKRVEFLRDFPEFINEQFEKYGLTNGNYYPDETPFLTWPPHDKNRNLNIQSTKKRVKKMVKAMAKDHRKYARKQWKKDLKRAIRASKY